MRVVATRDDPGLVDFRGLTDVAARSAREPAQGLFVAEGVKVIGRALRAGYVPRAVLCAPRWYDESLANALTESGYCAAGTGPGRPVEVLLADPDLLREVTGYRVHRGALASFERPLAPPVTQVIGAAGTVGVLVDLVDHTNVGAIFRNAAALGVDAILVTARCADPWYRRAIKVSMGAVFALPWTTLPPDWDGADLVAHLHDLGLHTYALTPREAAVDIRNLRVCRPAALLIGTEGAGLPDETLAAATCMARIPMHHGVDSLNVAAASAIAFHHFAGPTERAPR